KDAAVGASNLSELHLTLGDVARAIEVARQSVDLADHSLDAFMRMFMRTTLADALQQSGRPEETGEAERLLLEADAMQKEKQPEHLQLYSVQPYRYCDLLLSRGAFEAVIERAEQTLKEAERDRLSLLAIALDHLALGRAWLARARGEKPATRDSLTS